MTDEIRQLGGLNELTPDGRDLRYGAIHPKVDIRELEGVDFMVDEPTIRDQNESPSGKDLCTTYGGGYLQEAHEGVPLNPEWLFAKEKQIEGDAGSWGADLRTFFKAATKFGALAEEQAQIYLNGLKGLLLDLRDYKNWAPELDKEAEIHKQQSYSFIDQGPYDDFFDALRAALWQYRDKKHLIGPGTIWRSNWINSPIIDRVEGSGFGHFFAFAGVKHIHGKAYLVNPNTAGKKVGDKGYFYLSREVVNREFKKYGAGMLIDMPKELAKELVKHQAKIGSWKAWFWKLWVHIKNGPY